tara:strand:- start:647 stop:1030 length:384 start_codon:yes stop_codon:yes gene_type:complete
MAVTDNLFDTTYISKKFNFKYFYRIKTEQPNNKSIIYEKHIDNSDYNITYSKLIKKNDYELYIGKDTVYIIYSIKNNMIIPKNIYFSKEDAILNRLYYFPNCLLVGLKLNKVYDNIYDFEHLTLVQD